MTKNITLFLLLGLMTLGVFFRFFNLNWGAPFYFHPDERNIASSVSQLQFPHQLNPRFFAYGSLPIYSIFFIGMITNLLTICKFTIETCTVHFDQAILISRIFSAFFSTILILLIYFIGKRIHSRRTGLIAAFFAATSVGFIQFAHFGTFEMWTTFLVTLLFYCSILYLETKNNKYLFLSAFIAGITIAIKISSIVLLLIPFFLLLKSLKKTRASFIQIPITSLSFLAISILVFISTNPYTLLDFQSFKGSIFYESRVATGELPVFYSQGFANTLPVFYQLFYVYPFLLNPLLTIIFIPCCLYLLLKRKRYYFLLLSFFVVLFFSQAFLFVKWTRYIVPTLPFIYLTISIATIEVLSYLETKYKVSSIKYLVLTTIGLVCFVFSFSYFVTVLWKPDSRIEAAGWAKKNISSNARIMSEVYDLGIIPFNSSFQNITLFDFYVLDSDSNEYNPKTLQDQLQKADYIVIPSQRILKSRLANQNMYPYGYEFYNKVLSETDFKKVFQTQCDIFCKIIYMGNPVFSYEESSSVFDRPEIFIFKKI